MCRRQRTHEKQIFSAICLPRDFDMKSLMVTPRGTRRPSDLPNALHAAARAVLDEAGPEVGFAYFDFALQKRGLFGLMFGPILVERAKYPELNEAASAVFGLLQRVAVSANEWPYEDEVAGMAAWGLVMACSPASSPRRGQEGLPNGILVQTRALS
jgi:hypothetical protein